MKQKFGYLTKNQSACLICGLQCCRSGSGFGFSEFRIRIQPILFKYIWKNKTHIFNSVKKKDLPTTVQSYSTHSPEFTRLKIKLEITFFFTTFCWIRNNNPDPGKSFDPCGSGTLVALQKNKQSNAASSVADPYLTVDDPHRSCRTIGRMSGCGLDLCPS